MPPPSKKQISFAKSIATRRNEQLPTDVELDAAACNAYIDKFKDSVPQTAAQRPSEPQERYATTIFKALSDSISEQEFKRALTEAGLCSAFIRRHEDAFKEQKAADRRHGSAGIVGRC